jgi:hypothetical protein
MTDLPQQNQCAVVFRRQCASGKNIYLRDIALPRPNRVRLIPEELAVARCCFRVLVDRHQDRSDMVIAPAFMHPDAPNFGQGF